MAAIDKIYVNSYEEMTQFKNWLKEQPKLKDKYGKEVSLLLYFFDWWDDIEYWKEGNSCHPIYSAPCYVDAYIIRNCPLDFIQKSLMLNYGHQEIGGEGIVTMPNAEKSDYQKILDGELYTSPSIADKYTRGKHFKIVKLPYQHKYNYPIRGRWFVSITLPYYVTEGYMSHSTYKKSKIGTWDFMSEFVESEDGWSSSTAYCPSLKSLTRRIRKWNFPIGTIVRLRGRYVGENYKILVKK